MLLRNSCCRIAFCKSALCLCCNVVEKAVRDARVAESQAERVAQARVRAARLTDLPFLLAGAAEQGAIAARGDAMVNNNDFFFIS